MNGSIRWLPLLAGLVASTAWAAEKPVASACKPSRACAIELAREAGRKNFKSTGEVREYAMALLAIGHMQLAAGDKAGLDATIAEIKKVIESYKRGSDEAGYRSSVAALQVRAGSLEDALATARSARDSKQRDDAYKSISAALATVGRWREALEFAKQVKRDEEYSTAEWDVIGVLIETGRRDWVIEAAPTLTPGDEAVALVRLELKSGNFEAALNEAQRFPDMTLRLNLVSEIGSEADRQEKWEELAAAARLLAPDAAKVEADRAPVYFEIAVQWLVKAWKFDEAIALLPKFPADEQAAKRADIASVRARAGEYRKAEAMLRSIQRDYKSGVQDAIETGKVLSGDVKLDPAFPKIVDRDARIDALELLGEKLPDSRRDEVRAALRQAVELTQGPYIDDRAIRLGMLASQQAKRGFFDDALATAQLVKNTEELLGAYGDIGVAQASKGLLDDARRTFVIAEAQARKHGFSAEDQAWLIESIANAGLLPEAFAQIQAMCHRKPAGYWFNQDLDSSILMHIKAGQLQRAFEIAAMLSDAQSSDPHYFLVIANALKP